MILAISLVFQKVEVAAIRAFSNGALTFKTDLWHKSAECYIVVFAEYRTELRAVHLIADIFIYAASHVEMDLFTITPYLRPSSLPN